MTEENIHQRINEWYKIEEQTWTESYELASGIWVYKNVLPKELKIIDVMNQVLENKSSPYNWEQAYVGYQQYMPEYRDCHDFKYKLGTGDPNSIYTKIIDNLYQQIIFRKAQAVKDYSFKYKIGELRYWEAINLVKYGPGEHFQEHSDHGYSYNCTVSLVAYPNDNYQGGEINFRLQGLTIKPDAGDLFIFPSNYMYPHRAMPVISGTKYSLVTMLDYSDKYHSPEFYQETGS